ncbi:hypothetical protein [Clostridium sp.]|uniref:hypothetical protein n=1 Tax=Clostridium sp. TaxID=1506 RepID=UPI0025B7C691|nr:hypothetical protein [Clostridium sp.]MCI1714728.1 hypothetical protein [Clostridium sp.]MCI1799083.1 hypothetical protein [Clostridium sp.]MCI1812911.1 hypothetical protein [Clostridium sp.]MCI2200854.1 hypothetical protein [Clostridium sp.]
MANPTVGTDIISNPSKDALADILLENDKLKRNVTLSMQAYIRNFTGSQPMFTRTKSGVLTSYSPLKFT